MIRVGWLFTLEGVRLEGLLSDMGTEMVVKMCVKVRSAGRSQGVDVMVDEGAVVMRVDWWFKENWWRECFRETVYVVHGVVVTLVNQKLASHEKNIVDEDGITSLGSIRR